MLPVQHQQQQQAPPPRSPSIPNHSYRVSLRAQHYARRHVDREAAAFVTGWGLDLQRLPPVGGGHSQRLLPLQLLLLQRPVTTMAYSPFDKRALISQVSFVLHSSEISQKMVLVTVYTISLT